MNGLAAENRCSVAEWREHSGCLSSMIEVVAFDADDTLWHNVPLFDEATVRFREMLTAYHSPQWVEERLYETETRNLRHYGYGIKSFTLSMVETAIELTEGRITAAEIQEMLDFGKEMLRAPVKLLEHAERTVRQLAQSRVLLIVTKGDLFDQESKLARSGLGDYFAAMEVVCEKDRPTYEAIIEKCGVAAREFVMIGDSLKSDVFPVLEAGASAIHVPYENQWRYELVDEQVRARYRYSCVKSLRDVPTRIEALDGTR